jgi:AraC-like DNA-binding protein
MQVARVIRLSEPYLQRLFYREYGKTLREHLLDTRMSRAAELLKDFGRPIKQVASECGYSDISNFYRDFKRAHAATPRELRLQALADVEPYIQQSGSGFPQQDRQ